MTISNTNEAIWISDPVIIKKRVRETTIFLLGFLVGHLLGIVITLIVLGGVGG